MTEDLSSNFHSAMITRVIRETSNSCSFEFRLVGNASESIRVEPGQFMLIRFKIGGEVCDRFYAVSSLAARGDTPRFTVRRQGAGRVSNWCNDFLRPGAMIAVSAPMGTFLVRDDVRPLIFMAAGIGIAPLFPMLTEALKFGGRRVLLMVFDRDIASAVFLPGLRDLASWYADRMELVEIYTGSGPAKESLIMPHLARITHADLYMCGPPGFLQCARQAAQRAGIPDERMFINAREEFLAECLTGTPEVTARYPALTSLSRAKVADCR